MALSPKPVPHRLLDWKYLRPPNLDYAYFAAAGAHPFNPAERGHCAGNATWLADAALLAYAPASFGIPKLHDAGFKLPQCLSGKSSQAYIAEGDGFVLAAFRGTRIDDAPSFIANMINNLRFSLVPAATGTGMVHRGFQDSLDEIWPRVGPVLEAHRRAGKTLWLTGHSLGAAMACLATARLGDEARLYTFACPRVGDADFAETLAASHVGRFVYDDDVIPRVPPREMGFEHGAARRLIDREGQVRMSEDPSKELDLGGRIDYARGLLQLNLFDHSPVLYAVHVWNAFVATNG